MNLTALICFIAFLFFTWFLTLYILFGKIVFPFDENTKIDSENNKEICYENSKTQKFENCVKKKVALFVFLTGTIFSVALFCLIFNSMIGMAVALSIFLLVSVVGLYYFKKIKNIKSKNNQKK